MPYHKCPFGGFYDVFWFYKNEAPGRVARPGYCLLFGLPPPSIVAIGDYLDLVHLEFLWRELPLLDRLAADVEEIPHSIRLRRATLGDVLPDVCEPVGEILAEHCPKCLRRLLDRCGALVHLSKSVHYYSHHA